MAVINGAFHNGSTTTHVVTVPAGVTPTHRALIVLATGDNVAVTMTPSTSGSGTVTALDSVRQATNTYVGIFEGYGLTAGDTITIVLNISKFADIAHTYDDSIASYGAVAFGTRPASQASTTSGSTTPSAGQRVRVIGVDRTTVGPTVSSVTSSGGETVTQVDFNHDAASVQPVVGVYFGEFTASAAAARTATVTMSSASTNGYAAVIPITPLGGTLYSYATDHSDPIFAPTSWFSTLLSPGGWFSRSWAPLLIAPAGPSQIDGAYYSAAPNTVHTITVPTGVTPSMHMVMMSGTGDLTNVTQTATTSSTGKFTKLHDDLATNTDVGIWIGYGFTAGDTITVTLSASKALDIGHWYEDGVTYGYATPGIRPASQAFTDSGVIPARSGQRILVLGLDRTITTPTVSSVTSSGGETVTQRDYQHSTSNANVGMFIGEFTASASANRTATVTMSGASANGLAALIHIYDASHTAVDAWMAESPNYCAHRGGSADWVEMTEYAYDQAAAWSKKLALEVSVWKTSDGVWVASHDQTTARMFTTNTDIPSNTWATISGYTTTTGGYPIARLETILDQHQDRVIFVDNKQNTNVTAFLDFLDLYGGKDRIISKGYINSVGTANAANTRGYTTWGYLYDADVAVNLPANQGSWDILGMDYTGTAPNWAAVMAYGKPTLGHIIDTAAAATTAFSRGATGLQVSKVTLVVPPSGVTLFFQALTATSSGVATRVIRAGRSVAAASTSVASMIKQARATKSASSTGVASKTIRVGKNMVGVGTGTATVTPSLLFFRNLTATASSAASIAKSIGKNFSISSTGTPTFSRAVSKTISGSATGVATAIKQASRSLSASSTGSATVAPSRLFLRALTATATGAGTLIRSVGLSRSTSSTGNATISRGVSRTISAAATGTASLVKRVGKIFSPSSTGTPSIVKQASRTISATATGIATVVPQKLTGLIQIALTATSTGTATMVKQASKAMSATGTATATMVKRANKTITVTSTAVATRVVSVRKTLTATSTGVSTVVTQKIQGLILVTLTATSNGVASIQKMAGRALSTSSGSVATMTKRAGKAVVATSVGVAYFTRNIRHIMIASAQGVAILSRGFQRTLTATAGSVASLVRQLLSNLPVSRGGITRMVGGLGMTRARGGAGKSGVQGTMGSSSTDGNTGRTSMERHEDG